jgi:hypothetical protein
MLLSRQEALRVELEVLFVSRLLFFTAAGTADTAGIGVDILVSAETKSGSLRRILPVFKID